MRFGAVSSLCAALVVSVSLLVPPAASAKQVAAFGSLTITLADGVTPPATTALVGAAIIANPGLEKTITLQIPPFTFPIAVDTNTSNPAPGNLDTIIVVTNTSGAGLTIKLNARDAAGNPIALTTDTFVLAANATLAIMLSTLL